MHDSSSGLQDRNPSRFVIFLVLWVSLCVTQFQASEAACVVQQSPSTAAATSSQSEELQKALKYHKALVRRPSPGYLFDRFYNSWLDSSSLEELGEFLKTNAEKSAQTPDRLLLAFFHAKAGDDVAALTQFREALKNDPGNAATLYEKAVVEARTLDFETALADLAAASQANPSTEDAIKVAQLRGKLLVRNRQTEEAIKVWDELLKSNPGDAGLLEDMVEVLIAEGLYEKANEWSDKLIAITKDPFQKVVRELRKGDIYQRSGKRKKAIEVYGNALDKVGMDSWLEREILGQIDQLFRREDDLVGLGEHLTGMIKKDDKRLAIRKAASKIQMELGTPDQAIETFQKIVDLTPGDRGNREAFVALLVRAEKTEKAVKQMESLVTQNANDAELRLRLAELCHKVSQSDKAKTAVEKFVELSGNSEYAFLRAARVFEKFSDNDSASATYGKAMTAFADSDAVKESWATFLFRSDKKKEAIEVWKELAKKCDRAGLVRLARIASTRKENQAAMDMLMARFDELKFDTIYLGQLCVEAIALKKYEQAVPWAMDRVRLSKTANDIDTCMNHSVEIIASAEKSNEVIEQLQNKGSRNAPESCLLVELLERSLLTEEADSFLAKSIAAASEKNDLQILARQKVRLFVGRQDWIAAAGAAREMIDLPGGRKSVNVRKLVELYVRAGDENSALQWVAEWKRLSPGSLLPWLNESNLLERSGKYKEAINVLRSATRKFDNEPDLFAQLAQKYLNNGQSEDAQRIFWRQYDESEKLSDKLRWAERLASMADDSGEVGKLVEKFEQRRKNNPKSIGPLLAIAQAHRVADNYEERRTALLEATRLQKDNLPLLMEIARMEESEGDWQKAIETLERASLLDKTNRATQKIARIYIEYGETKEGLSRLLEIAGGANSSARDVEKIAGSIVEVEDWQQLRDFMAPQVDRFNKDYRIQFLLAISNEELGYTVEARRQFLELLNAKDEISSLVTTGNPMQQYFQSQYQQLKGMMPESAIEFMTLISYSEETAYAYRQDSNRYGGFGGYGGGGAKMAYLPESLESCRKYALAHLRVLSEDDSEDEKKSLRSALIRAGINNVDLVMSGYSQNLMSDDPTAILSDNPENTDALAIATMAGSSQGGLEEADVLRSYNTFKDSYPSLAFLAAMQMDLEKEEGQQIFEAILDKVKDVEKPNMSMVMLVAQKLTEIEATGDESQVGIGKFRDKMNSLVTTWYSKMEPNQASSWMFSHVVSSLRSEKSPKQFIEFLDGEIERARNQKKTQRSTAWNPFGSSYGRRRGGLSIALPAFPPQSLFTFPSQVYSQLKLHSSDDERNFYDPYDSDDDEPMTKTQIVEAVSFAKDPMLKTLLQVKFFETESSTGDEATTLGDKVADAKTALDTLLASDRQNIDAWYLAACLATHEKRWEDAANMFEKMRSLPMNAQYRNMVDGHLVAIATQGLVEDLKKKENEKVVMSANSAALRLRRGRLSQQDRMGLVSVFETLGLNEEAEKMESKIASSSSGSRSFGRGSTPSMPAPASRVAELADSGKSDAASRLLSQEFRTLARSALDFDSMGHGSYEIREFRSKLDETGLKKEVLAQLNPGESTNSRKLSTWAVAVELLSDKKESIDVYKKLLESNPNEDESRLRLLMLQSSMGEDTLAEHFPKVGKRNRARFVPALLSSLSARELPGDQILNTVDSVYKYLDANPGEFKDLSWVGTLIHYASGNLSLASNDYEFRTASVYAKPTEESEEEKKEKEKESRSRKKKREKVAALEIRQRELHDRIARKMIDIPEVSSSGFTSLLASRESAGKPVDEEMIQLALKAVFPEEKKNSRSAAFANAYPHMHYSSGSDSKSVTKRSPVEFLARHYGFDESAHDEQIETIATRLESRKAKENAAKLRGIYQLCKASDAKYVEVASSQIETVKSGSRRTREALWQSTMGNVFEIWKDRELDVDISDLVLDYAGREQNNPSFGYGYGGGNGDSVVSGFLSSVTKNKGVEATGEFLTKLRASLLGGEEKEAELLTLLEDQKKAARSRRKLMPLMQYLSVVQGLTTSRDTFFLAFKEISRFKTPGGGPGQRLEYRLSEIIQKFKASEADEFIAWLESANLLADMEDFDPMYKGEGEDQGDSIWGETLQSLEYRIGDEIKSAVLEKLEKKKDMKFGETVLMEFLKNRRPNIYNIMGQSVDSFESLSEEKQSELARFAAKVNTNARNMGGVRSGTLTAEAKRVSKICNARLSASMGSLVEKVLKAKRFRDLGVEEYGFDDWSKSLLASLDQSDTDKIVKVISKLADLSKNNRSYNGGHNAGSQRSQLVSSSLANVNMDSMKVLLNILENDEFKDFTFDTELTQRVTAFLKSEFESLRKKVDKATSKSNNNQIAAKTIDALQNRLGDEFGDRPMHGMISQFQRFYGQLTKSERKSIDEWFKLEASGKHPKIGNTMKLAWLSMREGMNRRDAKSKSKSDKGSVIPRLDELLPHQVEMLALAKDESIPIQSRLQVAMSLTMLDEQLPAKGVWESYATISKAVEGKAKLGDSAVARLFKVSLDLESDDGFTDSAGGLAKKWAQAKIKKSRSGYYGSYWGSEESPTVGAIRILAKTDNLPTLKKLLASDRNSNDASILVALIEADLGAEARTRSQAMWRDSNFFNSLEHGSHRYSKALEQKLPEFVKLFKNDGDKFFAELFFASFANSESDASPFGNENADTKVKSTPKERLTVLSKRFPTTEFRSKRMRTLSMVLLSDCPGAAAAIREPLAELAADMKIEQLIERNNADMQMKLLAAWLGVEASFGNFDPVRKMYRTVNGLSDGQTESDGNPFEDNWEVRQLMSSVSDSISNSFSDQIENGETEAIEKLIPVLAELNAPSLEYRMSPELNVMAHLVTNRTDELIKAWESAPKNEGDEDSNEGPDMDDFLKQIKKYADGRKIEDKAERAKLVVDVWSLGAKGNFSVGSGHYQAGIQESCSGCRKSKFGIEQLADLELLNDEQILEYGPQLAELNSVKGEVWRQVAKRQFKAEKFEEACESFEKALAASKKDMKQAKINRKVEYANALVKLGRNDDAKKQLVDIKPGQLSQLLGDNVETFDQLKTTLELK